MGDAAIEISPKKHTVKIEYCAPCDYSDHTLRAAQELVKNYQHVPDELVLEMGSGSTRVITFKLIRVASAPNR